MDKALRKCLAGDKQAWDAFVDRYARVIYSSVHRLLHRRGIRGEEQTAEDIAQDVFLRLIRDDFRLLRRYDPARASLVTWLTIVTRSTTIDFLRRRRLQALPLEEAPPLVAPAPAPGPTNPTEELPEGVLTGRQRLVLQLLFDREMDAAEAASLLGVSPQTIRTTKHKAIERLRKHFAGNPR